MFFISAGLCALTPEKFEFHRCTNAGLSYIILWTVNRGMCTLLGFYESLSNFVDSFSRRVLLQDSDCHLTLSLARNLSNYALIAFTSGVSRLYVL